MEKITIKQKIKELREQARPLIAEQKKLLSQKYLDVKAINKINKEIFKIRQEIENLIWKNQEKEF